MHMCTLYTYIIINIISSVYTISNEIIRGCKTNLEPDLPPNLGGFLCKTDLEPRLYE